MSGKLESDMVVKQVSKPKNGRKRYPPALNEPISANGSDAEKNAKHDDKMSRDKGKNKGPLEIVRWKEEGSNCGNLESLNRGCIDIPASDLDTIQGVIAELKINENEKARLESDQVYFKERLKVTCEKIGFWKTRIKELTEQLKKLQNEQEILKMIDELGWSGEEGTTKFLKTLRIFSSFKQNGSAVELLEGLCDVLDIDIDSLILSPRTGAACDEKRAERNDTEEGNGGKVGEDSREDYVDEGGKVDNESDGDGLIVVDGKKNVADSDEKGDADYGYDGKKQMDDIGLSDDYDSGEDQDDKDEHIMEKNRAKGMEEDLAKLNKMSKKKSGKRSKGWGRLGCWFRGRFIRTRQFKRQRTSAANKNK